MWIKLYANVVCTINLKNLFTFRSDVGENGKPTIVLVTSSGHEEVVQYDDCDVRDKDLCRLTAQCVATNSI